MQVQLYILGLLLRYGPQYGYSLKQIIEDEIADFAQIKTPTIYYHLEKLNEKGYVTASIQRSGNYPEKTVYHITEDGEQYFHQLLKKLLSNMLNLEFPFDGALYFREMIDSEEFKQSIDALILALEEKLKRVTVRRDKTLPSIPEYGKSNARAIFNHHILHMRAELEWLNELKEDS